MRRVWGIGFLERLKLTPDQITAQFGPVTAALNSFRRRMMFTKHAIETMGFTEYPGSDVLEIEFRIIRVYSIQGLNFSQKSDSRLSGEFEFGENCTAIISDSVNLACKTLCGEDLVEDEEKWLKEKKQRPPFALIYFKEFKTRTLVGGHRKEDNEYIYTYDGFPNGKEDIRAWEKDSLPKIFTALVVHLSTLERPIMLIPLERAISGKTNTGKTLFDMKLTAKADIVVSSGRTSIELDQLLEKSSNLYKNIDNKTSKHLHRAFNEKDRLKQFLSYFLFIEVNTHKEFNGISYEGDASSVFMMPERLNRTANEFFKNRFSESKNLSQRFHWCSILSWSQINDQDIDDFLYIKKIRDKLAHGEDIDEADFPVEKARNLSLKILGTQ